jgi:hypothetical protein
MDYAMTLELKRKTLWEGVGTGRRSDEGGGPSHGPAHTAHGRRPTGSRCRHPGHFTLAAQAPPPSAATCSSRST